MIRIDSAIEIGCSPAEVFGLMTDVERMAEWHSGVIESKPISPGPMRTDFQFAETARVGPWKLKAVCTVTEFEPVERIAVTAAGRLIAYESTFNLEPVGAGSRVTLRGSAQLKGAWRLLQPLFASDLRREARTDLAALKRLAEAGTSQRTHPARRARHDGR